MHHWGNGEGTRGLCLPSLQLPVTYNYFRQKSKLTLAGVCVLTLLYVEQPGALRWALGQAGTGWDRLCDLPKGPQLTCQSRGGLGLLTAQSYPR